MRKRTSKNTSILQLTDMKYLNQIFFWYKGVQFVVSAFNATLLHAIPTTSIWQFFQCSTSYCNTDLTTNIEDRNLNCRWFLLQRRQGPNILVQSINACRHLHIYMNKNIAREKKTRTSLPNRATLVTQIARVCTTCRRCEVASGCGVGGWTGDGASARAANCS